MAMQIKSLPLLFAVLFSLPALSQTAGRLEVIEKVLDNGMTVWLNQDKGQPKIFGAVVVRAGAKDCPDTGIAHYFEHMMFKGTDKIGTIDYEAEKVYLDSIAVEYDKLGRTTDAEERERLQKEINRLSIKASEYAIPNEFSNLIARYGGSGLNAGTSYDLTVYYNEFSPQYISQWAELNSERLLNPVFRLFQGELETVYEEKNMYSDDIMSSALEEVTAKVFAGHPYAYPIIGSTWNLKNPNLREMEDFFRKYYVASNMGLILSGDFEAEEIMPIIEKAFGRIPKGEKPRRIKYIAPIPRERTEKIALPIPLLKGEVLVFRGPVAGEADDNAVNLALQLLSNDNGIGLLDSLGNTHKIMGAGAFNMQLDEAGALAIGVIPKVPFGSVAKAEKMVWEQVERLKIGDFSAGMLEQLKAGMIDGKMREIETVSGRSEAMMSVMGAERTWQDYLDQIANIAGITKEDIAKVSSKYFNDKFLRFEKKFGQQLKDNLSQPGYSPIPSHNADTSSAYARELAEMPVPHIPARLLDFSKDVTITPLKGGSRLFCAENPVNDLFSLSICFHKGSIDDKFMEPLAEYLPGIGTDSLSRQEFGKALLAIGAEISFEASPKSFTIKMSGRDSELGKALGLLKHFASRAKADKESYKDLVSSYSIAESTFSKDADAVAEAVALFVAQGKASKYLDSVRAKELKRIKGENLIGIFRDVQDYQSSVTYCGKHTPTDVVALLERHFPINGTKELSDKHRPLLKTEEPVVYIYDMPQSRQTIIGTYQSLGPAENAEQKVAASLWGEYFGGGFSSIMFQEIREFRSLAYRASGNVIHPDPLFAGEESGFYTMLSTQKDKAMEAVGVLDSLLRKMPAHAKLLDAVKRESLNQINNDYPSFRDKAEVIAQAVLQGYNEDAHADKTRFVPGMEMKDVIGFYESKVLPSHRVIFLIGDKKAMDIKALAGYGRVKEIKLSDVYR